MVQLELWKRGLIIDLKQLPTLRGILQKLVLNKKKGVKQNDEEEKNEGSGENTVGV